MVSQICQAVLKGGEENIQQVLGGGGGDGVGEGVIGVSSIGEVGAVTFGLSPCEP